MGDKKKVRQQNGFRLLLQQRSIARRLYPSEMWGQCEARWRQKDVWSKIAKNKLLLCEVERSKICLMTLERSFYCYSRYLSTMYMTSEKRTHHVVQLSFI